MAKLMHIISDSLKGRVEKVISKPKRRRIAPKLVRTTNDKDCRYQILQEIAQLEHKQREAEDKTSCSLCAFIFGIPKWVIEEKDKEKWEEHGCKVAPLTNSEIKRLHLTKGSLEY
jgi:hypothetical protein